MKKITSFQLDHDSHTQGFYLSSVAHGIYTYDLRLKKPNSGDYVSYAALHTIEHIFATVIRNSEIADFVVYFGPMGCRTGFYLLLRDIGYNQALTITIAAIQKCLEQDEIPGAKREECGNYLEHDLEGARAELKKYLGIINPDAYCFT
ncbi:MAG: S-ribosylhomocysteine lyase [Christensenellales bacterium]|jgi:S-ribosylhomocysteine lyase